MDDDSGEQITKDADQWVEVMAVLYERMAVCTSVEENRMYADMGYCIAYKYERINRNYNGNIYKVGCFTIDIVARANEAQSLNPCNPSDST